MRIIALSVGNVCITTTRHTQGVAFMTRRNILAWFNGPTFGVLFTEHRFGLCIESIEGCGEVLPYVIHDLQNLPMCNFA